MLCNFDLLPLICHLLRLQLRIRCIVCIFKETLAHQISLALIHIKVLFVVVKGCIHVNATVLVDIVI